MNSKIGFFVAGAQKAGTTALESFLASHAGLQMGIRKELHYFDNESLGWGNPDYWQLHTNYLGPADGRLRGEATPVYMYWPNAMERLRAYNPDARLIVLLRHPAYRAYSHWKMETARGNEDFPFRLAVSDAGRLRVAAQPRGVHRVYSYVERGFYADQIVRLHRLFPPHNILFLTTEALWSDPVASLNKVAEFLGIARNGFSAVEPGYVVPFAAATFDSLAPQERQQLCALYCDDIRDTALLTGLDLAHWLEPDYAEPMSPALRPVRVMRAA